MTLILNPCRQVTVVKIIHGMRGKITWAKIEGKVRAADINVTSRALRANTTIKAAYNDCLSRGREKRKQQNESRKNSSGLANDTATQAKLEVENRELKERLSTILANAVALGIDPRRIERPLNVADFGNTYKRTTKGIAEP
ncbi:MAG: hypothetical protein ABJ364_08135 [Lentilitoribacter sp.]